jgi:ABC-2 type transport system ATP-binding protein
MERTLIIEFYDEVDDFEVENTELLKSEGNMKWFKFNRHKTTPSSIINYISTKYQIKDLAVNEPEVEELIRDIYNNKKL